MLNEAGHIKKEICNNFITTKREVFGPLFLFVDMSAKIPEDLLHEQRQAHIG